MAAWFSDVPPSHAVYETLYHLVWSPKYRRDALPGEIPPRVRELFADIAEQYNITIEEMEVSPDHIHIFCSFPPRYSIVQVVTLFKSLSARAIFREFPRIKRRLGGGELWEDGYFARTVGDKITAEVIRRYIQYHRTEKAGESQLKLFE
ncbi:MAG TPA: IS200/IS605 family transposase [Candidatus Competibacteraceae bacterium]|nr:IS200/IS605 family transposase [Candidatus Competibacteraceae bacterium]